MQLFGGIQTLSPTTVRNQHKLMMGPWAHGGFGTAHVGTCTQGQLTYNEACGWSDSLALRFFDYYLRDSANGWNSEPVIRYFQMGENTWQETPTWPPTGTTPIKLFFNESNSLTPFPTRFGKRIGKHHLRPAQSVPDHWRLHVTERFTTRPLRSGPYSGIKE